MKKVYQAFILTGAFLFLLNVSVLNAQNKPLTKQEEIAKMKADREKFNEDYKAGFEQFVKERDEAIQKMDDEFKEFLKKEWTNYELFKAEQLKPEPKPDSEPVFKAEGDKKPTQLQAEAPKKIESTAVAPVLPILAKTAPENYQPKSGSFGFYGSNLDMKYDSKFITSFPSTISEEVIANNWDEMSKTNYPDIINQLNSFKTQMNLNDWGYYLLVKNASKQISGDEFKPDQRINAIINAIEQN